jgi:hypothetical protein
MKSFLAAQALVFGLIPLFIITMWLASEDHMMLAILSMTSLVANFAFLMHIITEIDIEDRARNTSHNIVGE